MEVLSEILKAFGQISLPDDNTIGIALFGLIIAGVTTVMNNSNSWLSKFYDTRRNFLEANNKVVSFMLDGWFLLWKIRIDEFSRKRIWYVNLGGIISEKDEKTIIYAFKDVDHYISDDHNISDLDTLHEKCDECVKILESHDPIIAYKLRGALHYAIYVVPKIQASTKEFLRSDKNIIERLCEYNRATDDFTIPFQTDVLEELVKKITIKYNIFSIPAIWFYFWIKKIQMRALSNDLFSTNESFVLNISYYTTRWVCKLWNVFKPAKYFGIVPLFNFIKRDVSNGMRLANNIDSIDECSAPAGKRTRSEIH